ncbi:MAG: HDOD domain-containing protein [Pseudomonadota bacterium]
MAAFDSLDTRPRTPPLRPFPNPPENARVRALLMGDAHGELQVLAPERALVDVTALNAALGRQLRVRPHQADEARSAVPGYYGVPTVVEESLLERRELALATTEPGSFLRTRGRALPTGAVGATGVQRARFARDVAGDPTPAARDGDRAAIHASLSRFTVLRLQQRLDETLHIPPLPEMARRIIALQSDPSFPLRDLVEIVETDPSVAARVMGWANSAFYNPDPPARSIHEAVVRVLGLDTVMSMALGMALGQALRLPEARTRGMPAFWLEAVTTAAAMEALARRMPHRPSAGTSYVAGLLANFGTLVLGHVFPPQYATICLLQEANRHLPHTHVDHHVLALPREVLAAALLECWSLPAEVTDAVRFQYRPDHRGPSTSYVALLRVSRKLLGTQGLTDHPPQPPEPAELAALGLEQEDLQQVLGLLHDCADQLDRLAGSLGS